MITKAQKLIEDLEGLDNLVGEEMTNNPMGGGALQGFPSEYRGMAKVTKIKDDSAKQWYGVGMPLFIDVAKGETNLMAPDGEKLSMQQVGNWFDLEAITVHP